MPLPPADWTPTMAEYHAYPAWGSSMLADLRDNRRLARELYVTRTIEPPPPSSSMKLGTLVHAIIEAAAAGKPCPVVSIAGDRRSKAYRDAASSAPSTMLVYPQADVDHAMGVARAILEPKTAAARAARGVLVDHPGVSEYSLRWQHSPHVELKVRYDRLAQTPVGWCNSDLKTSRDPAPEAFKQSVKSYHYAHALALRDLGAERLGIEIAHHFLVAVRSEAPFEVGVYQLDSSALAAAREFLRVELMELEERLAGDESAWHHDWEKDVTPLTAEEIA